MFLIFCYDYLSFSQNEENTIVFLRFHNKCEPNRTIKSKLLGDGNRYRYIFPSSLCDINMQSELEQLLKGYRLVLYKISWNGLLSLLVVRIRHGTFLLMTSSSLLWAKDTKQPLWPKQAFLTRRWHSLSSLHLGQSPSVHLPDTEKGININLHALLHHWTFSLFKFRYSFSYLIALWLETQALKIFYQGKEYTQYSSGKMKLIGLQRSNSL